MKRFFSSVWEIIKIFIIAALIVIPIRYFLFQPFIVRGQSMEPSLEDGDYLIVDEISYRFRPPQRGEIIVFQYSQGPPSNFISRMLGMPGTSLLIKRVIGLPGETIKIEENKVIIYKGDNSLILEEDYLPSSLPTPGDTQVILGENEYFVMGDNRPFSFDSRRFGVLSGDKIIGRAVLRTWPIDSFLVIEAPAY